VTAPVLEVRDLRVAYGHVEAVRGDADLVAPPRLLAQRDEGLRAPVAETSRMRRRRARGEERAARCRVEHDPRPVDEEHARRRADLAGRQVERAAPHEALPAAGGRDAEAAHVDRLTGALAAGRERAGIADVAHPVAVAVRLGGVRDARAVVAAVRHAVAVRVGFTDENGPKGAPGIRCAFTIDMARRRALHVEHTAATPRQAFDLAFEALERRALQEIDRARDRRRRPKKYFLAKRLLESGAAQTREPRTRQRRTA